MKSVPVVIAGIQLDLHGCEYHESQQLSHIDGFLVYYNGRGRLTVSMDLTDEEKLQGVQRLLDYLEQTVVREPQLYFWTRGDLDSTNTSNQTPLMVSSPPHPSTPAQPTDAVVTIWPNLASTDDTPRQLFSLLHVPRTIVHTAARTISNQLQTRRGVDQDEHTLIEADTPSGHYASLSMHPMTGPHWSLLVRIEPPIQGLVGVTLGSHTFQAALTNTATARLDGIPLELLLDVDGPDVEVWLEQVVTNELS